MENVITVKQYVLLCTATTLLPIKDRPSLIRPGKNAYKEACCPIGKIVCVDGTQISVQAHSGCHTVFADVKPDANYWHYAPNIGYELAMCETNSEELDQYGIDDIDDIQKVVDSHGGIDLDATIYRLIDIVR